MEPLIEALDLLCQSDEALALELSDQLDCTLIVVDGLHEDTRQVQAIVLGQRQHEQLPLDAVLQNEELMQDRSPCGATTTAEAIIITTISIIITTTTSMTTSWFVQQSFHLHQQQLVLHYRRRDHTIQSHRLDQQSMDRMQHSVDELTTTGALAAIILTTHESLQIILISDHHDLRKTSTAPLQVMTSALHPSDLTQLGFHLTEAALLEDSCPVLLLCNSSIGGGGSLSSYHLHTLPRLFIRHTCLQIVDMIKHDTWMVRRRMI